MSNAFKTLFGIPEKKDRTFRGPKPLGPLDTEMGKTLKGTLEERLSGRGVGFRQGFLEKATTPYAVQARAGLKEETIPQISQQASAKGLGRSTIPVQRTALASQAVERDVADFVGKVSLMDEQQRRVEINDALGKFQQLTGDVVAGENLKSQFEYAEHLANLGRMQEADAARTKAYQMIAMTTAGLVAGGAGAIGAAGAGTAAASQAGYAAAAGQFGAIGTGTAAGSAAASGFGVGAGSIFAGAAKGALTGYTVSQSTDYLDRLLNQARVQR